MQTRIQGTVMPVLDVQLDPNESVFSESGELSWMTASIQMTTHTQMGGDGFLLQKLGGQGTAWLELSGELIMKDLAPGEVLRVHPGHVGAFQASVGFQITTVPGLKNMFFGGDGIFLAVMQGPGRIWLQTLPISRLAHQIAEYLPRTESRHAGPAVGGALLGGIVGSILGGDQ